MNKQTSEITEEDIQKAINYLRINKSPEEATRENAIKYLQGMQITAHMIAHDVVDKEVVEKSEKGKTYKSFLMGAKDITDSDLTNLNIEIISDENPEISKLIIPSESIEEYKELIRQKLDSGFWNDFVGEDLIYFIFKMPDGEITEYSYSEDDRLEIATLCTKLNNDPIEKTSNLLDYLAENEFYTDVVKDFKEKH